MTSLGPVRLCRDRPTDRAWHLAHGQECAQCWPDTDGLTEQDFTYLRETRPAPPQPDPDWRSHMLAAEFGPDDIPDELAA